MEGKGLEEGKVNITPGKIFGKPQNIITNIAGVLLKQNNLLSIKDYTVLNKHIGYL